MAIPGALCYYIVNNMNRFHFLTDRKDEKWFFVLNNLNRRDAYEKNKFQTHQCRFYLG